MSIKMTIWSFSMKRRCTFIADIVDIVDIVDRRQVSVLFIHLKATTEDSFRRSVDSDLCSHFVVL